MAAPLTIPNAPAPRPAGPASPIIRFTAVRKSFGSQVVLDGVDIDFEPVKTTVVMGPSGSGKSVLLKHIVGLLKPDSGSIFFDGQRIDTLGERELNPVRLQVGLVFQMGALFDSMDVSENLQFPMIEHTRWEKAERLERVHAALDMVDLAGVAHKLPSELSGGQRKRVALARAIVLHPRVVLYDEPTTGLDPIRSDGINELIIKLKERLGVTNIVVTHDLAGARKVSDRVVMLLGGKIAADGTYDQLASSSDERVHHFLTGTYDRSDESPEILERRPPTRRDQLETME